MQQFVNDSRGFGDGADRAAIHEPRIAENHPNRILTPNGLGTDGLASGQKLLDSRPMSWWNARKAAEILEPEPIVHQDQMQDHQSSDRVAETLAAMKLAKSVLDAIADEQKEFRRQYGIIENRFGQVKACTIPPGKSRREIDLLHQALERRLARALHVFSARQKEWSNAQNENRLGSIS